MEPTAREMRLLEGLRWQPRKSFAGRVRGERLTARKGVSIEFADYRDYAEGDDLRHLDWNVLARLDQPLVKTYRDEEDLAVHLLIDLSPSMAFGEPSKADTALRLALALGFLTLAGGDAALPFPIGARGRPPGAFRGRAGYPRLVAWARLIAENPEPGPGLAGSLRAFAKSGARRGLCIVLTDGLDPDAPAAVRALAGAGHEPAVVQILSPAERDPDLEGDLRLLDAESGRHVEITANAMVLREYRRRLADHEASLADAARRGGGRFARFDTGDDLARLIRDVLRREGWVRG